MIYNNNEWSYLPSDAGDHNNISSVTSDTNIKSGWVFRVVEAFIRMMKEYTNTIQQVTVCAPDEAFSLAADKKGNVWIGHGNCITQYNGSAFIKHEGTSFNAVQRIEDIEIDAEGNPWAACTDGILYYDGTEWIKYRT
jgi:ligand-binding sensor domain-containing protein